MNAIKQESTGHDPGLRFHLFTAADLAVMPTQLPSGPVMYELDHGRLVAMAPPGDQHAAVESNLTADLKVQGERRGLGKVRCGEVAIILQRNPDHVRAADVAFIANQSLPIRRSPEGYLETIPELVVEVRSKNDSGPEIERMVAEYLAAGVRVVWIADPAARTVTEHRPGQPPTLFGEADTLAAEDIVPGFRMAIQEVFRE